ncbi:MAG TPA: deoxyguanosinetriphosphate triphosphohydrolase [Lentisphaeria bacterium]|nr:MAG: hypothetical protein A2X47_12345 [Lentisphaerae bacterium GWF2_38_69]HBM17198.1 deoxyguanosinetriphosphate triphosphohydrolase [Lentisphaeria bacterium]
MLKGLSDYYKFEDDFLSSYALKSHTSKGRRYPEKDHPIRTAFQRDRDRILHSREFRRLEYKTQVFLNGVGDHYRTRLTHTIEVAAISRTLARALGLNEDLAETIALAHDIGHPPFGHTGENKLNEIMRNYDSSFEHNDYSIILVDELIEKYPQFDGLNLTRETREGLIKHREGKNVELDGIPLPLNLSLESQVADIADDLTYYGHDIDDGLESGLISVNDIAHLDIWKKASDISLRHGNSKSNRKYARFVVRCLIDSMVKDVIDESAENIRTMKIKTPEDAQNTLARVIEFSSAFKEMTISLKEFLFRNIYWNEKVLEVNRACADKIEKLFNYYLEEKTPHTDFINRITPQFGLEHAICYYIAGMTDRFALEEYNRFFSDKFRA